MQRNIDAKHYLVKKSAWRLLHAPTPTLVPKGTNRLQPLCDQMPLFHNNSNLKLFLIQTSQCFKAVVDELLLECLTKIHNNIVMCIIDLV